MADVRYGRILVGTDGSADATAALEHAIAVARAFGSSLVVVAVVDIYPMMDPQSALGAPDVLERERAFLAKSAEDAAARARAAGLAEVETAVLDGSPKAALVDAIQTYRADLVVVGTHGRGALERLLIGSTSEHLIRNAASPVLVVRPPPRS